MKTKKQNINKVESEIEKEYKKVFNDIRPKIQEKLDLAVKAMNEAQELADAHGIPFSSQLSFFGNDSYIPESFADIRSKFSDHPDEEDYDNPSNPKLVRLADMLNTNLIHIDSWENEPYDGWASDGWSYSSMFC